MWRGLAGCVFDDKLFHRLNRPRRWESAGRGLTLRARFRCALDAILGRVDLYAEEGERVRFQLDASIFTLKRDLRGGTLPLPAGELRHTRGARSAVSFSWTCRCSRLAPRRFKLTRPSTGLTAFLTQPNTPTATAESGQSRSPLRSSIVQRKSSAAGEVRCHAAGLVARQPLVADTVQVPPISFFAVPRARGPPRIRAELWPRAAADFFWCHPPKRRPLHGGGSAAARLSANVSSPWRTRRSASARPAARGSARLPLRIRRLRWSRNVGASSGEYLRGRIMHALHDGDFEELFIFYRCHRATLRARLAIAVGARPTHAGEMGTADAHVSAARDRGRSEAGKEPQSMIRKGG